jgi:UDP-N-acetylglucosamine 2-epimerase (non-hydrolysing)
MTVPEEINRIVTDSICDHFFTTSRHAGRLLESTGVDRERIHFVGNTMIDTLYQHLDRLERPACWVENDLRENEYFLLTLHRPANVDDAGKLTAFLSAVLDGVDGRKVVFPVHPRTRRTLASAGFANDSLIAIDPLGYLQFIYLLKYARAVITDSGGITEEATVLDIPCMTLRDSTERPETVEIGTNELVGTDPVALAGYFAGLSRGEWKTGTIPELWDGHASERIVDTLLRIYGGREATAGSLRAVFEKV